MRREKSRKRMAKAKETEPVPSEFPLGFPSGFLSGAFSRLLAGESPVPSTPPKFDTDLKRALQKYRAPEEVERLKGQVKRLEEQEAARKRAASTSRKCPLWDIVHTFKKDYPARRSDLNYIARYADKTLENRGLTLAVAGPKTWKKLPGFPRLLAYALRHDKYKFHVRRFLSKVPSR
jgi:hypothetical protein